MQKEVKYVPTSLIIPNAYQPRKYFNEEAIEELAQSIKNYGIIQPLSVRKFNEDKFELIAGERRFRAAKKLNLEKVPVIIIDMSDKDSAAVALLENLQRENLNFLEEAEAYSNLINKHNYTQSGLSQVIGKKQSTIANKLRILKLDRKLLKVLLENNLTERHARALLKVPNTQIQEKILQIIISKKLNVKSTEELINNELLKITGVKHNLKDKKSIKGIFSPRIYVNTVKQVFDKYGVKANYRTKELEDEIQVIISISKK